MIIKPQPGAVTVEESISITVSVMELKKEKTQSQESEVLKKARTKHFLERTNVLKVKSKE